MSNTECGLIGANGEAGTLVKILPGNAGSECVKHKEP